MVEYMLLVKGVSPDRGLETGFEGPGHSTNTGLGNILSGQLTKHLRDHPRLLINLRDFLGLQIYLPRELLGWFINLRDVLR